MEMQHRVAIHLCHHQHLFEKLKAEFPDADEETLRDTLEGLTDLPEMLGAVVRSQLDDKSLVIALRGRIGEMKERLARFETRAQKKRDLVMTTMENADLRKLTETLP